MYRLVLFLVVAAAAGAQPASTPQPGDPAPDPGIEAFLEAPALASWAGLEGRAVVMDLWATWCAPCIATMPHMADLEAAFVGRPVQFLSVTDEPVETVEPFLEERRVAGWVGLDEGGSAKAAYGVIGIPAVVLVYPDGTLAAVTTPDHVDAEAVEALLAGAPLDVPPMPTGASIQELAEQARSTRPPVADGPATADVRWDSVRVGGGFRSNVVEGWLSADDVDLPTLLLVAWTSHLPFGENPIPNPVRRRLIDVPADLRTRGVDAEVRFEGSTRETFGARLLLEVERALGLEVRFETRPTVAYALRLPPGGLHTLRPEGGRSSASARGHVFAATAVTTAELAQRLSSALGHPVADETGLDGTYSVVLELDPEVADFDPAAMSHASVEAVRAGLRAETGLELVPEVRPVEWLVGRRARD